MGDTSKQISANVINLIQREKSKGVDKLDYYKGFTDKVEQIKLDLLSFLIDQKKKGKKVAGYGAAAKGNSLLNYCGIKKDLISLVVDANPIKQDKFLPGSHIPVVNEEKMKLERPDFVIIFPWNLSVEIKQQLSYIREWGGRFLIPIPTIVID